jgi:hypothetical protein
MLKIIKRGIAVAAAAALPLALAASPASAAGAAEITGTELNTYLRESVEVTDAGGQKFSVSVLWAETYKTASGNIRVAVPEVKINAIGVDEDRDGNGDGGVDARIRVYQGYASGDTKKIQDVTLNGVNDPVRFNPLNPLNRPEITKIVVSGVGVDDDGYAGAAAVTFEQPVIGNEDPLTDGEGRTEAEDDAL